MIQIIPENRRQSTADRFAQAFSNLGQNAGQAIPELLMGQHQKKQQLQQQQQIAQQLQNLTGMDLSNLPPEMQQKFAEIALKNQQESQQNQLKTRAEDERYKTIEKYFGKKEAEIYKAAPEGGKTEILKYLYDRAEREGSLNQNLQDQGILPEIEGEEVTSKPSSKTIDFDKGLTPKEKVRRQEARYSTNLPLYQTSVEKKRALDSEKDHLEILEDLSPQIGTIERVNINPQTGELFLPGLASEAAQRYVKTLNDFTTNAKDSYGARVTNFDLQQFMKRLPSLANSEEGRKQIVKQMQIINSINSLREQAIQDVIDRHGGIRNIDYDQAERIAEKESSLETAKLKAEFKKIDSSLNKQYEAKIKEKKAIVPKDHVAVQRADGTTGYIPKENLKKFLEQPGNKTL